MPLGFEYDTPTRAGLQYAEIQCVPKPVTAVIVGAGDRGKTYASYALSKPECLQIVGVADPKAASRSWMQEKYHLPDQALSADWRELTGRPRIADAAIICTPDAMHTEPAIAFARLGYAILLEKPMAPTEEECVRIIEAVKEAGVLFAVCHVMRYTAYTQTLKELLGSGAIGEIVSVQHLEPVGHWHFAHSYVRGNWRNTQESSFLLLSKACHDLDWIHYVLGERCLSLSSFGALKHFKHSEKPIAAGTAARCVECDFERQCAYSAKTIYLGRLERAETWWPVDVLAPNPTLENITAAITTGPYGRCVYECDNDVVDNQVVSMLFDHDKTATFTVTAFGRATDRRTRIFGTGGEIYGDGVSVELFDFLTNTSNVFPIESPVNPTTLRWHGGGDYQLIERFVDAVAQNDQGLILSGPEESLETHRLVFAAERARITHAVVDL